MQRERERERERTPVLEIYEAMFTSTERLTAVGSDGLDHDPSPPNSCIREKCNYFNEATLLNLPK